MTATAAARGSKVLVTGATGFVGASLVRKARYETATRRRESLTAKLTSLSRRASMAPT